MKIRTTYPGQEPQIIDAPQHIVDLFERGLGLPPNMELLEEDVRPGSRLRQMDIDDYHTPSPTLMSRPNLELRRRLRGDSQK